MFTAGYLFTFNYILGENRKALPNEASNPVGLLLKLIIITRLKGSSLRQGFLWFVMMFVCMYECECLTVLLCNHPPVGIHVYHSKQTQHKHLPLLWNRYEK